MASYRVTFDLRNGSFSREVEAGDEVDAAFIGTLDLVHAIDQMGREDLLTESLWTTPQALALQVDTVQVEKL